MLNTGFETITVATTAIGPTSATLNSSTHGQADRALFGPLETAQIRWRDDGTAPTSTVGHLMQIGDVLEYDGDLSKILFIRTGGTSGALPCAYYQAG